MSKIIITGLKIDNKYALQKLKEIFENVTEPYSIPLGLLCINTINNQYDDNIINHIDTKILTFNNFIECYEKYDKLYIKFAPLINTNKHTRLSKFYQNIIDKNDLCKKLFSDETIARSNINDLNKVLVIFNKIFHYLKIPLTQIHIPSNLLIHIIHVIDNLIINYNTNNYELILFLINEYLNQDSIMFFMEHYIKKLQNRILNKKLSLKIEEKIISIFDKSKFNYHVNFDLSKFNYHVNKMHDILNDVKYSNKVNNKNKNMPFNLICKYYNKSNWDIDSHFNGYCASITSTLMINELIKVNADVIPYIKLFDKHFDIHDINYESSTCVIKIDQLTIKCNLLQYIIISVILNNPISAINLSTITNIKLLFLTDTLNSLLVSKIINKSKSISVKDPNIILSFNKNIVTDNNINLIDVLEQVKKLIRKPHSNIKLEVELKTKICEKILINKHMHYNEIIQEMSKTYQDATPFIITNTINKLEDKGVIRKSYTDDKIYHLVS